MVRYEVLFLTVPEITGDEIATIEKNVEQEVKNSKGTMLSFERWGKCRLAYPIRHNDYGVYFLTRFESAPNQKLLQALQAIFMVRHNEIVMRIVTHKLEEGQTLEYKRPDSVEEAPTRDVDSFLRENQMEGLVSKGRHEKSSHFSNDETNDLTLQEGN